MAAKRKSSSRTAADGQKSERTKSLRKAKDAEEGAFPHLAEAAQCVLVLLRPDRAIAYINAFGGKLTGYAPERIRGMDYFHLLVPENVRSEVVERFEGALSGVPTDDFDQPILAKDGSVRWIVGSFRLCGDFREGPAVLLTAYDITERKGYEEVQAQRTRDLHERSKELNCLFVLSELVEEPDINMEGIFQGVLDILTRSWQYPDAACARIVFENQEYRTENFVETTWRQTSPVQVHGKPAGRVEVCYLKRKPRADEGPFLKEERKLLDAIAERLGRIAERIKAEKELQEERDFAESLIETAPAIVLLLDAEGRIVRINPYLEEISGYRLQEVEGKDWFEIFLPERYRDQVRGLFQRAVSGVQTRGNINPILAKDGRERVIEWYDKTLADASGNVVGVLAVGQDVTERRKLEKRISEITTTEQQRIGQELHDGLGQELTGLGYLAETLHRDLRNRGAADPDTADRLASGIQHVLQQTRTIAKGLISPGITTGGLMSALEQLVANTEHRCGVTCRFLCNRSAPIEDTATATQLFRIAQEAVNNAVKHAEAKEICVQMTTERNRIILQVSDNGAGIPTDLDETLGMGLRIIHHRAGMIGATLDICPGDDGGTLVRCVLPRRAQMTMGATDSTTRRTYKILIVDDHPIVRHGLRQLIALQPDLEVCGEGADASEALRLVQADLPDAAIVDISLEGESGIKLIEQFKAICPELKVLVSSIHDEKVFAARALRAGAMGYVNKRESIRTVIDAVREVLRGEIYLSPGMTSRFLHRAAVGQPLDPNPIETLSIREFEVFEMIGQGLTTQQIARRLQLNRSTIETHRKKIRTKLNLQNSAQLNRHAFQWVQENR